MNIRWTADSTGSDGIATYHGPMPPPRWLLAGAVFGFAALALVAATVGGPKPAAIVPGSPSPSDRSSPRVSIVPTPASSPTRGVTPTAIPPSTRPTGAPPRATGAPRLAYAEFLLRLNDDRTTVEALNRTLAAAADAQNLDAVRTAAVAILDFVDVERDWLRGHPPADCYSVAHASATAMLDAYGTAADRFVDWSAAGGGLNGLAALGLAVDAASAAGDALTTFGTVLGGTTCAT